MHILFPGKNYEQATREAQLSKLSERRFLLTKRYANKISQNPKFKHVFKRREGIKTRGVRLYQEKRYRRNRHKFSALPVITKILNGEKDVFRNWDTKGFTWYCTYVDIWIVDLLVDPFRNCVKKEDYGYGYWKLHCIPNAPLYFLKWSCPTTSNE